MQHVDELHFFALRYEQQAALTVAEIATSTEGVDLSEGDELREQPNPRTKVQLVLEQAELERGTHQGPAAEQQIKIAENDAQAATIAIQAAKIEAQADMIEALTAKIDEFERNNAVVAH